MTIDLQEIVTIVSAFSVIGGAIFAAYKVLSTHLLRRISKLEKELNNISKWAEKQQKDIENGVLFDMLMLESILACLDGLKQQGCNGKVSKGIEDINKFLIEKANTTFSHKL